MKRAGNVVRGQEITDAQIAEADAVFAAIVKALDTGINALRELEKTRTELIDALELAATQLKRFLMDSKGSI